jgi:anti-sigma28 factor (negative regulator of flagellin synthesis)
MRITPNVVVSPVASATAERSEVKAPKTPQETTSTVVTLSSAGAPSGEDIGARLDKIRAAIDAGEYPIDLDKLASRIVDDEVIRTRTSS